MENETKSNIIVGIRVRPPLPREIQAGEYQKCVLVPPKSAGSDGEKVFVSLSGKAIAVS